MTGRGNGGTSIIAEKRRGYARRVEVVSRNKVRIRGLRSELLRTLTAAAGLEAAGSSVRSFEPKWRPIGDKTGHSDHWIISVGRG